jgi:tRNA-dihydrouridine synthase B
MKNFWKKINKPILALAPMAEFTDSAFREICRKYGADVVYSEMASASGLYYNPKKTLGLLNFNKSERPYVVQLFGSNPEHFAKAARIVTEKIKPDGIDINFGCPVKKVMKTHAGCALMQNPKLAREIIRAVCENTNLPVSIKIRAGISAKVEPSNLKGLTLAIKAVDFIKKIKDLPFQAVMIHCRTYEQGFSGAPDYSVAEEIKKIIPDKIVLVNGGINTVEDGIKILKDYPTIEGLGIARGALGQPWIFEEIKSQLKNCREREFAFQKTGTHICVPYNKYNLSQTKKILLAHAKLVYKNKGAQGLKELRAHIGWYIKGFPGASELRKKLVGFRTISQLESGLKKFKF